MAEINTTINLRDGMSQPLRHMIKAMNVLVSTVQSVASKTKAPIDTKALVTAREELGRATLLLDKMGNSAANVTKVTRAMATATTNAAAVNGKFIAKVMNSTHRVNQKLITDAQKVAQAKERSINKTIASMRKATEQAVAANEREQRSVERLANSRDRAITRTVAGIYTATRAFDNKTLNMRIASQKTTERYIANIHKREEAEGKATQRELSNILKASLNKIALSYKVQGIVDKINSDELAKNTKRVQTEIANEGNKLKAVLNSSMQQMEWARKTADFVESVNNKGWQSAIKRGQAEHAQMMKSHQAKCAAILSEFELSRKTKAWLESVNNKAWSDTIKRGQAEEALIRKREAAAIAAVKREGAAKWAAFDRDQNSMRKLILQSEKRIQKEKQMLPAINQNTEAQKRHNQAIRQGVSNTNMLWSKIKGLAGAYIGVQTVGGIIKTADALAANEARLNLMVKEGETVKGLSDKIYAAAMRSRTGYLAMADSVAKLGIQAGHLFGNNDQMVRFMETFNKVAVISKSTTQQTNAAMTQLIQALSFGQLRGDELKSILENMPFVAHLIADELERVGYAASDLPKKLRHIAEDGKVTEDEIRAIGYEGELASETVVNAMVNGAKKVDKMAKNMTWTWAQVWEVFKNAALRAFTPIFEGISKIIQTDRFKRFATWVDGAMTRVANAMVGLWNTAGPIIAKIFDGVAAIGNFIGRNWSFIAPIVWGIVAAFAAYKTALMLVALWQGICTVATTGLTIAKIIGVFATKGITAATARWAKIQLGLNATLFACPLTWIVLAIIAVIVVIYLAVAAINHFAGTSYSATGFIAGVFMALFALIYNNVAIIWNAFASFAEFLVNVFKHPAYATKKLFVDLAVNIIDCLIAMTKGCDDFATSFVNAMYSAINFVLDGWNWMVDKLGIVGEKMGLGKAAKLEASTSITSDLTNAKAAIESSVADMPADYWEAPKMEYKDIGGYYMKGYNWGKGVADKFDGLMSGASLEELKKLGDLDKKLKQGDFSKALEGGYDDPKTANGAKDVRNPALDKISDNTDKIADSSGQTAENTSQNDEYFKYLRRAGERHSMNRQQLLNFKVDMSNVNHINSGADYDEMLRRLAKELYRQVVGKMNGVAY